MPVQSAYRKKQIQQLVVDMFSISDVSKNGPIKNKNALSASNLIPIHIVSIVGNVPSCMWKSSFNKLGETKFRTRLNYNRV